MKIVSQYREQARRVYYGAVFEAKKEIPVVIGGVRIGWVNFSGSLRARKQWP